MDKPPEPDSVGTKFDDFVDALFEEHREWLVRRIARLAPRRDPRDIVHDVYLRARKNGALLFNHDNPLGWVIRTAKNLVIERGRHDAMAERHIPSIAPVLYPRDDDLPMWQRVPPRVLQRAIRRLEPDDQALARMRLQDFKFKNIAAALDCPVATAYRRFRAMLTRLETIVREEIEA